MSIKKILSLIILLLSLGLFFAPKTNAALTNVSVQLSTSRPSAAAPVATGISSGVGQVIVADLPISGYNSALWISSDSARFLNNLGNPTDRLNVASMSAANTPSSNQRIVFFTGSTTTAHTAGETLITPITATHTIKFTTSASVVGGGHIVLTFPGSGSNSASPSATGFSFNNISSSEIQTDNATCSSWNISGSTMDCTLNGSGISAGATVTVEVGCLTNSSGVCTSFKPMLINPIKSSNISGTADQWKIVVKTQDNSGVDQDTTTAIAGIIESVQIQGTIEPYMTMTISGIANGASICGDTTNPGPGLDSTATFVNLGSLTSGKRNVSAQNIQIDTNASYGYTLTATSSGHFINPGSGIFLPDANTGNNGLGLAGNDSTNGTNPAPAAITPGTNAFGIHPCIGSGSTTSPTIPTGWGSGGGASNKYANPWNLGISGFHGLLASTSVPSAVSITSVEYGATISPTAPAGIYSTTFTYVATANF